MNKVAKILDKIMSVIEIIVFSILSLIIISIFIFGGSISVQIGDSNTHEFNINKINFNKIYEKIDSII